MVFAELYRSQHLESVVVRDDIDWSLYALANEWKERCPGAFESSMDTEPSQMYTKLYTFAMQVLLIPKERF